MVSPGATRRTPTSADDGARQPADLARRLVEAGRSGHADDEACAALARLEPHRLALELADPAERLAFWINLYNGYVRARLLADPDAYRRRMDFFGAPAGKVAGRSLSANAIEHGMLRRSAFLLGLGYVRNPLPSRFERLLRVARVDARVHFALNCGARSCPPLRVWHAATLEADLEAAAGAYLKSESAMLPDGSIRVSPMLRWYSGDFGGRTGVRSLLARHGIVESGSTPKLSFGPYDWSIALD